LRKNCARLGRAPYWRNYNSLLQKLFTKLICSHLAVTFNYYFEEENSKDFFYLNRRKMRKIISFDVADAIAMKMSYLLSLSSARILDQLIASERTAVARWPALRTHIPKN
jgi:hypothetical protein